MREAIGSTWLIYLVIVFLLVYIFFIGFVMNYASAYRAANYIVTQIESCQGYKDCRSNFDEKYVSSKYHYKGQVDVDCSSVSGTEGSKVKGLVVYDVTLYVDFDVPMLGNFRAFKVKAETKSMHNTTCKDGQYSINIT